MRRALPALAATAAGMTLLMRFHTTGVDSPRVGAVGSPSTEASAAPTSGPVTSGVRPSSSTSTAGQAAATIRRPARPTPASAPGMPTTTAAAPAAVTRTVEGPSVESGYGAVQVRVTLQGRRIVDVVAVQLPADRARSRQISARAAPSLRREALAAQSASIDTVSGASYTSKAYAGSLQAALSRG